MKLELASIATNEKHLLKGFKVLGVIPFYLTYITTGTHIKLCAIREKINQLTDKEPSFDDFHNHELQSKLTPLVNEYCEVALLNGRAFSFLYRKSLKRTILKCGHNHILNLYATIQQLDQPAFFLSYWKSLKMQDHTILSEVKRS
jgi:hypothetical protein